MNGCTTLLVGKDATKDGSVLAAFNSDGGLASRLVLQGRGCHTAGTTIPIYCDWRTEKRVVATRVPQVTETAQVLGTDYLPAMNEYGVGMVLNACRSRAVLQRDRASCISHFQLLQIALERARSAREAIHIMGSLIEELGLLDIGPFPSGKNIGVIDSQEAWWFQAPGGHQWLAIRIPDQAVSFNANRFWVGAVDLKDEENVLASRELVSFAVEQGWHNPDQPFDFTDAYGDKDGGPVPSSHRVYSTLREWRMAYLLTGQMQPPPKQGKEWEGPHIVIPRGQLELPDVYRILRDHYEGTVFDTHRPENGGDAHGCPHPPFAIPTPYPRPIDMFNTQMSYVAQSRSCVPEATRGRLWYAVHSPSTGCYVPFFPSGQRLPSCYATGSQSESAFWKQFTLNLLIRHNWTELAPLAQASFRRLEGQWIAKLPDVDKHVRDLSTTSVQLAQQFLADNSNEAADATLGIVAELTDAVRLRLAEAMMQETLDEILPECGE